MADSVEYQIFIGCKDSQIVMIFTTNKIFRYLYAINPCASVVFIPAFWYNIPVVYLFDKGRTEGFGGASIWTFEMDRKPMMTGKCCLH